MKSVFFTDLDNTIIYSCRHEIGRDKLCVELYQGREVSFVTIKTWEMLRQVKERALLIPVTTRTIEQYDRIQLKVETPEYALVCNGGILLEKGVENPVWYQDSLALTADCREELKAAQLLMERDKNRSFEVRNIRELFLFTKSEKPEKSVEYLEKRLDTEHVCIFQNGAKVYVLPKNLNKGAAVKRFLQKLQREGQETGTVYAAGDSGFDISMLQQAQISFAPAALGNSYKLPEQTLVVEDQEMFSEAVLRRILQQTGNIHNLNMFCGGKEVEI
ncbi:HAD hydrolase family protein [Lachnospiraceae bacterium 45-W7]